MPKTEFVVVENSSLAEAETVVLCLALYTARDLADGNSDRLLPANRLRGEQMGKGLLEAANEMLRQWLPSGQRHY